VIREFTYRRRVEFAETDMAGMAHFSVFLRYVEEAEHAMWREAGLNIADPDSPCGFPRVSFAIDYKAPLAFQDEFEVRLQLVSLSARSLKYSATLVRGETTIATSTHTVVCIRRTPAPIRATEIPADIVARLRSRAESPAFAPRRGRALRRGKPRR
jgi:YbgC/YbaW family acyl-CoA thioester hydrolase